MTTMLDPLSPSAVQGRKDAQYDMTKYVASDALSARLPTESAATPVTPSTSTIFSSRTGAVTPGKPSMIRTGTDTPVTSIRLGAMRAASPYGAYSPRKVREGSATGRSLAMSPAATRSYRCSSPAQTMPLSPRNSPSTTLTSSQRGYPTPLGTSSFSLMTQPGSMTGRSAMTSPVQSFSFASGKTQVQNVFCVTPTSKPDQAQPQEEKEGKEKVLITPAADFSRTDLNEKDLDEKEEHLIFNWLHWSPDPSSKIYQALHKCFPGVIPGEAVNNRIKSLLQGEKYGFNKANTLVGYSLCPDEINYEPGCLVDLMKQEWGHMFPLGGISGAPFVGVTGFAAFSHHVPDDGNIIIIYGPHVAVSREGLIGKVRREGQQTLSTACGAVIGAYNACSAAGNTKDGEDQYNPSDMQMGWIKSQLEAHIGLVQAQPEPMAALAFQAYEMVKAKLEKILNLDWGSGKLALIGGIQINMPEPFQEHFLPISFEFRQRGQPPQDLLPEFDCDFSDQRVNFARQWTPVRFSRRAATGLPSDVGGDSTMFKELNVKAANFDRSADLALDETLGKQHAVFAWLSWSPEPGTPCFKTLHREFPGALPGSGVHHRLKRVLTEEHGFTQANTLLGTSTCPDEINNKSDGLVAQMAGFWGSVFPLGGLAGVPFAGKTGFKAFSHHVPDNGDIIVVYGPHVGISESGEVGKYLRKGQDDVSTACGACIGAYNACAAAGGGDLEFDEADIQMGFIKSQLAPHTKRIQRQRCPMAALAYQAFETVKSKVSKVVNTEFGSGRLVLIGGIQLNVTEPYGDHFLPLSCEVMQAGKPVVDIRDVFMVPESDFVEDAAPDFAGA